MASLDGKVALVTGGARGIGAETARLLIARGARVALLDLDGEQLAATAAELGPSAVPFVADVTDTAGLEQAVAAAVRELGGIDVALVNAGVATFGTVRTIDPAAFEGTIEINLLGAWRTIRACLPHVVERRGYVLVVASMAAILQGAGHGGLQREQGGASRRSPTRCASRSATSASTWGRLLHVDRHADGPLRRRGAARLRAPALPPQRGRSRGPTRRRWRPPPPRPGSSGARRRSSCRGGWA